MTVNRKWLVIGGGVIVCIAGAVTALMLMNQPASPPEVGVATTQEAAQYLVSEDFKKLSDDKKQKYVSEIFESDQGRAVMREVHENMTDEQRHELHQSMGNVFRRRMEKEMDNYFKLPPEERVAQLDKMIDRMQEMRNRPRPPRENEGEDNQNRPRGGPGRHGPPSPDRIRSHIEHTSPERRAQFVEFHKAMMARMKERGIEPRWGRPRR